MKLNSYGFTYNKLSRLWHLKVLTPIGEVDAKISDAQAKQIKSAEQLAGQLLALGFDSGRRNVGEALEIQRRKVADLEAKIRAAIATLGGRDGY